MVKFFQDFFRSQVFTNLAVEIEGDHVASADGRGHTEPLFQAFLFRLLHLGFRHADDEANRRVCVVFFVVLSKDEHTVNKVWMTGNRTWTNLECRLNFVCSHDPFFQHLFVILSPFSHGQLGDFDCCVVNLLEDTGASELVLGNSLNSPLWKTRWIQ